MPSVALSFRGDRFRVVVAFADPEPGEQLGGTFDKHHVALDYARRLATRKGWPLLNVELAAPARIHPFFSRAA